MKKTMIIFVVDHTLNQTKFKDFYEEYTKNIQWGFNNINHKNVIPIRDADIFYLEKTGIVNIISDINNSFPIGNGEDDLIMENDIKIQILTKIKNLNIKNNDLINKLINIFEYSIKYDRWIIFAF